MAHGHASVMSKPPEFNPLLLTPSLWLDAADTSTVTSSAGVVSQWNDKSGNGFHAIQGTAALRPSTGIATQNGLNVISFTDHQLKVPLTVTRNFISVFAVALRTGVGASVNSSARVVSMWNTADSAQNIGEFNNTNGILIAAYNNTFGGITPAVVPYRNAASIATLQLTYNVANITGFVMSGGNVIVRHNRTEATGTTSTTSVNSNEFLIGGAPFQGVNRDGNLNGWVAEVIVVLRAVTTEEVIFTEKYLQGKWATV